MQTYGGYRGADEAHDPDDEEPEVFENEGGLKPRSVRDPIANILGFSFVTDRAKHERERK